VEGSGRDLILCTVLDLSGEIEENHDTYPGPSECSVLLNRRQPSILVLVRLLIAEGWDWH
jgi:hypothetical protein